MGSEFCFKKLMFPFKDYGIVESGEAAFEVDTFITRVQAGTTLVDCISFGDPLSQCNALEDAIHFQNQFLTFPCSLKSSGWTTIVSF